MTLEELEENEDEFNEEDERAIEMYRLESFVECAINKDIAIIGNYCLLFKKFLLV